MSTEKAHQQFTELKRKTLEARQEERRILREQEEAQKLAALELDIKRQTRKLEAAEESLARTKEAAPAPVSTAVVPPVRPAPPVVNEKDSSGPNDDEKEVR